MCIAPFQSVSLLHREAEIFKFETTEDNGKKLTPNKKNLSLFEKTVRRFTNLKTMRDHEKKTAKNK